jgi:hypothetical protein
VGPACPAGAWGTAFIERTSSADCLARRGVSIFAARILGISSNSTRPSFSTIFLKNILGLDSAVYEKGVSMFINQNRFIYESASREYQDFTTVKNEFEQAFRYLKYYFPDYKIPKIVTIVGPPDALAQTKNGEPTPNFLGPDFLGLSLQFYLGKDFSLYHENYFVTAIAPLYRSQRFEKNYIVADAMKLITDDLFPEKKSGKGLIEQMIEKGKQCWLLDKFLPNAPDSVKTGYTKQQLEWCRVNEGLIWNSIITNEKDIYTSDPAVLQNYIGEAPFTQSMSTASPGNIGQWVGCQIVKKFADKNSSLSIAEVMKMEPGKILELAKYKPK